MPFFCILTHCTITKYAPDQRLSCRNDALFLHTVHSFSNRVSICYLHHHLYIYYRCENGAKIPLSVYSCHLQSQNHSELLLILLLNDNIRKIVKKKKLLFFIQTEEQ